MHLSSGDLEDAFFAPEQYLRSRDSLTEEWLFSLSRNAAADHAERIVRGRPENYHADARLNKLHRGFLDNVPNTLLATARPYDYWTSMDKYEPWFLERRLQNLNEFISEFRSQ